MLTRSIPSTNEHLPVVGLGTYLGFNAEKGSPKDAILPGVLQSLFTAGGTVIDSSPMYGHAEEAVGRLLGFPPSIKPFLATKVWTTGRMNGIEQMNRSMSRMGVETMDLMQVHNMVDWRTHIDTLRNWKSEGRVRYIGVTPYTSSGYRDLAHIMRTEPLDFVQFNYSAIERGAEETLIPIAQDRGIAIIANMPFGGGDLINTLEQRVLPAFAAELGCASWPSLLLKFVLANPAITCVIPGTGNARHMQANVEAGFGLLPDKDLLAQIAASAQPFL